MKKNAVIFAKNDTKFVKGIAIILMLMHHLWSFADRQPGDGFALTRPLTGMEINGMPVFQSFGYFGKLCVPLFMFLAGYGLYKQYSRGNLSLSRKILKLYTGYWKIFVIFIPVAFLFFGRQAYLTEYSDAYQTFDLNTCILNFFGIDVGAYNGEWWFVMAFVIGCIVGYLYICFTKKLNNFYIEMFLAFVINFFIYMIVPMFITKEPFDAMLQSIGYRMFVSQVGVTAVFTGIIFAKYRILDRLMQKLSRVNALGLILLAAGVLVAVFYLRVFTGFEFSDFLPVPFFCAVFAALGRTNKAVYSVFGFLGKHSENMWLVHTFFCYRFSAFVRIIFRSGNAIIALLILIGLSLITSILLNGFYRFLKWMAKRCHLTLLKPEA